MQPLITELSDEGVPCRTAQHPRWVAWANWLRRAEPVFFLVFAAASTILSARKFLGARHAALRFSETARQALSLDDPIRQLTPVAWSAPLDDVFIHFDFARSLAQGHFFEWSPGGGYSSGATSWLYPAILGAAYRMGITGFALGYFADWLAAVCVFAAFLALRHAFGDRAWWFHYLCVAALSFQGVVAFALWSGMEFALFLLLWSCAHALFQALLREPQAAKRQRHAWALGLAGMLLAATRPEALVCVAVWALFAIRSVPPAQWEKRASALLAAAIVAPCCMYLAARAVVNRCLTGDFADAGSLAKLEFLAPHRNLLDFPWVWLKNMGFQLGRITAYHAGMYVALGCLLWVSVLGSMLMQRTRTDARVLGVMAALWMGLVASNEYVRYQNDRYTMAPLVWLILCAALATHGFIDAGLRSRAKSYAHRWSPALLACVTLTAWILNQAPRFAQQAWLFGRASRNVAEQQVRLGLLLSDAPERASHRLLVGDAGALEYFSQMPGVDAFGLGTTSKLPFAKAVRLGNGATVELIERMPDGARPDLMALYPSWWKDLPLWFGQRLLDVDITGNVMCGASKKVLYRADWGALDGSSSPIVAHDGWHVVDELDIADLVSEATHDFSVSRQASGYVFMKVLAKPDNPKHSLFDAGRILFDGDSMRFRMPQLSGHRNVRLVMRAAPHAPMSCRIVLNGHDRGGLTFAPKDSWVESFFDLDASPELQEAQFVIQAQRGECNLFHIWALQQD